MPRVGSKRRKTRTHKTTGEEELAALPSSMVIRRTSLSPDLASLRRELREVLYPFTAMRFEEVNRNKLHDFVQTGDSLGVKSYVFLSEKLGGTFVRLFAKEHKSFVFKVKAFSL